MKTASFLASIVLASGPSTAHPADDQSLIGVYRGSIQTNGLMTASVGAELTIERIENGFVNATLETYVRAEAGSGCGKYAMRGTYQDNRLKLRGKGGPSDTCHFRLELIRDGGKLTGTTGPGFPVSLAR